MSAPDHRIISRQYVTGDYGARCPGWHQDDSAWKAAQVMRVVPDGFWSGAAASTGGLRILDVGCGAGGVLGNLHRSLSAAGHGVTALGIDVSDEPLALARRNWPGLDFRRESLAGLRESFDVGLLMDVVEHVENPWQLIRDARARCRYLVFHIPLDDNLLTEVADLYAYKAEGMGHINFYTRRKALWLLESNGLEVLAERYTRAFAVESSLGLSFKHRLLSYPRRALAWVSAAACARLFGGMSLMVLTRSE